MVEPDIPARFIDGWKSLKDQGARSSVHRRQIQLAIKAGYGNGGPNTAFGTEFGLISNGLGEVFVRWINDTRRNAGNLEQGKQATK